MVANDNVGTTNIHQTRDVKLEDVMWT